MLIISTVMGHMSYVWKKPLSIRSHVFMSDTYGTNRPNHGTKAVGYLIRKILKSTWKDNSSQKVTIYNNYDASRNNSFLFFSGIGIIGKYFENILGIKPNFLLKNNMENISEILPKSIQPNASNCVVLNLDCDTFNENHNKRIKTYGYNIISRGKYIVNLFILTYGNVPDSIHEPGDYQLSNLEKEFDKKYTEINDYFPLPIVNPKTVSILLDGYW